MITWNNRDLSILTQVAYKELSATGKDTDQATIVKETMKLVESIEDVIKANELRVKDTPPF